MKRVLLINMPFAGLEFPSLALGLFKAKFQREGIPCDVAHLNLLFAEMAGWQNYALVGQFNGCFAGERLFAQVLFGDRVPSDAGYYAAVAAQIAADAPNRLAQMKSQVVPFLQLCLSQIPWRAYEIIGFTSLFEQNLPSLALALQIKTYYPDKIIVFGGANCEDVMGQALHRCFPFVDYVFCAEADHTFPELVKRLSAGRPVHDLPGLLYRRAGTSVYTGDAHQVIALDTLPVPNYDEYYEGLRARPQLAGVCPWIVLETARGCWWGQKTKCTFCGLNGKMIQFRSKSVPRVLDEIRYLLGRYGRYGISTLRVVDNVLNPDYFEDLLPQLSKISLGTRLFFEVRATLRKREIRALAEAGVTDIQAGLESLNTHMLKLMHKGTSSLQNIQLLKWSKQYGIEASWNLIYGFPGEVAEDYAGSLELVKVLTHLSPPVGFGPFRMDRFSYNFEHAEELGLMHVRPSQHYRYLYPFDEATLRDLAYYFDYERRQPIDDGGCLAPLATQVNAWRKRQDELASHRTDGRITIGDTRPVATAPQIVLDETVALVYEACDRARSVGQIGRWLRDRRGLDVGAEEIAGILTEFVEKRLTVREGGRYLSLAVMDYEVEDEEEDKP